MPHSKSVSAPARLSHFDEAGQAGMVDVARRLRYANCVYLSGIVLEAKSTWPPRIPENPKGDPLEVARFAGIQAAKRTADLIPMCHPLPLTHVDVQAAIEGDGVRITATVSTVGLTGVEMEAMTAASVAALTVYDMTKALDKAIVIRNVQLESKSGGKSGDYSREGGRA
jgi:cyclic pyranopterin phosphate synthase